MATLTISGYFINKAQVIAALPRLASYAELLNTYQVVGYTHDLVMLLELTGLVTHQELRHIQANATGLLFTEPETFTLVS